MMHERRKQFICDARLMKHDHRITDPWTKTFHKQPLKDETCAVTYTNVGFLFKGPFFPFPLNADAMCSYRYGAWERDSVRCASRKSWPENAFVPYRKKNIKERLKKRTKRRELINLWSACFSDEIKIISDERTLSRRYEINCWGYKFN